MKIKNINVLGFLMLALGVVCSAGGQDTAGQKTYKIIRSSLGSGGSSKTFATSKGQYKVSQSIGQSSVIGTYSKIGYHLRQGYQQPSSKIRVAKTSDENNLLATVLPNPFNHKISVSFNEKTDAPISVLIYDIGGKLIYTEEFSPSKNIQIDLRHVSMGSYLLKAFSNGKAFNAKLIKL
ncbi:T9SS type A sorting domain-containing protein [Hyunsoonleella rubra]|uniref:T9SS type A sorting domain-containing protein n=1 Tax=Hyunsoonleella rubra TaxID=1737062 RepID=A0ABW5TE68_9FLAO